MLVHYLHTILVRVRRNLFVTSVSVLTLALGLVCFMVAYGMAEWWRSTDTHHRDAGQIVVIGQGQARAGDSAGPPSDASNANLAPYLRVDYPELAPIARAMAETEVAVASGVGKALLNVASVDPEFLRLFEFEFTAGGAAEGFRQQGVILTEEAAARVFGTTPALGQRIRISNQSESIVVGVIRQPRQPSFMGPGAEARLRFDLLRSWGSRFGEADETTADNWMGTGPLTFAKLPRGMSLEALNRQLPDFVERRIPAGQRRTMAFELRAFPLHELATHRLDHALIRQSGLDMTVVTVLIGLGMLTLLIACVNYTNLAVAQASTRARETGLRKTLGAGRAQIMVHSWLEAAALTVAATVLALLALLMVAPAMRVRTGVDLLHFLTDGVRPLAMLAVLTTCVALIAGAYPALVLSRLQPVAALRPQSARGNSRRTARVLVGVQFAVASFLMILVAVTHMQRDYLQRTSLLPREDAIVILNDIMPLDLDFSTLKARLLLQPQVMGVSVVDRGPWNLNGDNVMAYTRTPGPEAGVQTAYLKNIDPDYFTTMNLDLLAGRFFQADRDLPASPLAYPASEYGIIIDQVYAQRLGFGRPEEAVGQLLHGVSRSAAAPPLPPARIIGVTESETTRLDAGSASGNIYAYLPRAFFGGQHPVVRVARPDLAEGVAGITRVWDELVPNVPANIRFFDALFESSFRTYARVGQLFVLLGGAALVISSLGLIGIAVHVIARRRREIGVRKVLGASAARVMRMLLWDFAKPVVVANFIAWPFAFIAAEAYLSAFATRAPLTSVPFLLGLAVTLLISGLAVGGQTWNAARVKPAPVLRAE